MVARLSICYTRNIIEITLERLRIILTRMMRYLRLGAFVALTAAMILSPTSSALAKSHTNTKKHIVHRPPTRNMRQVALRLEDALLTLNTNRVDLLYAYLQSVALTKGQIAAIDANASAMQAIVGHATGAAVLSESQKIELLRLFASSVDYAHLRVSFETTSGKPIDIATYKLSVKNHMYVLLLDNRGGVLATMRPHPGDLSSSVIVSYVREVDIAVEAAYTLEQGHHFVPMPRL